MPAPTLRPVVLRPRVSKVLIGIVTVLLVGPIHLQASLWSSVVLIRCTHVDAQPYDVACEVRRDAWITHESQSVTLPGVRAFEVHGNARGRGDAWIAAIRSGRDDGVATPVTPGLNVAKGEMIESARVLHEWLHSETWRDEVTTSYGSPVGAFYVPLLSLLAWAAAMFLVMQRVRMRLLPGGRVVVDASRWLGLRAPIELALDDLSFDGPRLVLVTSRGPLLLARSVFARRAEVVLAQGNAWLEAARGWREPTAA
ncbi:MAG: hypothetical protein JST00_05685 [Deltaproteobacteria bacterium]|nr:hypothetical protein [Deltaproteobacteria bacterium]